MNLKYLIGYCCFLFIFTFTCASNAQTSTGMVVGTITDASGAALSNATITLINGSTGVSQITKISEAGSFRFPAVAVGEYHLTAESQGFSKTTVEHVIVTVGQTTSTKVTLQVGGETQTIQVSDAGALSLQTESSQVQTLVSQREVENLPLNGRNFIQLEALQPNSVPLKRNSSSANRGGYNVIAGAPVQAVATTIDGINAKELLDPRTTILLNLDVMQEFQSASSNYTAAQGGAGGAQVNLVTKSGTNQFHGSMFEYFRNTVLNAKNFFATTTKPPYHQNQFGGSFGGPILKGKLFFFGGYEGLRIAQSLAQLFTVPTLAERGGDFTGKPQIYDPSTYDPVTGTRQPFKDNMIPSGMISSVSAKTLALLYPLPNLPGGVGGVNNLAGSKPNSQTTDQFSIRGDYNPDPASSIYVRYIYFNPRKLVGQNAQLPNFADNQNTPTHNVAIGYVRTLNPRIVNQFRTGYLRFTQILGDVQINVPIDQQIGITGTSTQFLGNPTIAITGFNSTGAITNAPNNRSDNGYYIYDDVLIQAGKHGLSIGGTGAIEQFNGGQNPNARGNFSFTNQYTEQIGQPSTGFALADFLLGFPATSARGIGSGFRNWRQDKYAFYVQDDWKMRSNLTINMGLRYEYTQPQYEAHNNVTGFLNGQIVQLGTNGVPRGLRNPYRKDFEPRVGFAYRPGDNGHTVIRSGYGITFIPLLFLTPAFAMSNNPPLFAAQSYVGATPIPNLTLANAFPANLGTTSTTLSTVDPKFRDGYIQQWNFIIERELPKNINFEIGYVGNKGSRLSYTENINASPAGPGNIQAKRPYPNFSSISDLASFASSTYNSMIVKTQRNFSGGVTFIASYTWAKSLSTPDQSLVGDGASSTSVRNPLDPKADKGRDVFDIRNRVSGSAVWDLPFGKGRKFGGSWHGFTQQALGDWRANVLVNLMTGYPLTPALGLDNANTGDSSQDRPDRIGDPNAGPRTIQKWFNTAAFTLPAKYSYGNTGTNIIDGPPQRTIDVSISKRWQLRDKATFEFRSDFFNAANTPQFDLPGGTYGTSTFGVISSAGDPRLIQFAARIEF